MTPVDVVVEASTFFSAPQGGVTRISREILPRMCSTDSDLTIELLTCAPPRGLLPAHSAIRHSPPLPIEAWLRPSRLWRRPAYWAKRAAYDVAARADRGRVWHSTYYTVPLRWRGPVVVTLHDFIYEKFPELFASGQAANAQRQKERAVHAADRVICVSESTRADALEHYGLDPEIFVTIPLASSDVFHVLPDADEQDAPDKLLASMARPFLLWVGGRRGYKDFRRFAHVFSAWHGGVDLGVVIVGAPLTKAESSLLEELGLGERILVLSGVQDEALCLLYNKAAALVYPSLYEGFGIPLLEAMSCGCPIVAARIPTSVEVAGDCAVLFSPGEPEDMMHAIATAVRDGRESPRTRRGLERATSFSWDKTALGTLRIYRELAPGA